MTISSPSFCASSGLFPAMYCSIESRRCLIIEPIVAMTSASSSAFFNSISRYMIWLLSSRSVPSRCLSRARAASFISESMRSVSIAVFGSGTKIGRRLQRVSAAFRETRPTLLSRGDWIRLREELHHSLPRLFQGALLGRQRLLLTFDRRLLVVLALPDFTQDASLLALFLEALHGVLERLAFLHSHARHVPNHHLPRNPNSGSQMFARSYPTKTAQYSREEAAVNARRTPRAL